MLHGPTCAVKLLKVKSQQSTHLSHVLLTLGWLDSDLTTSVTSSKHITVSLPHNTIAKAKLFLLINNSTCILLENEHNYVSFMLITEVWPSFLSQNSQMFKSNACRSLALKFTKTRKQICKFWTEIH